MTNYQVGPETFLTLRYQVFDAEGEEASVSEIIGAVFGMGQLLPALEKALDGHHQGERVEVTLQEKEAYGERNTSGILEVDRSDFPEDVSPGDRFEVENDQGGLLVLHVLDVQEDMVVVDTNHPLAGQEVKISVELLEVRPASPEEVEAAVLSLEDEALEGQQRQASMIDAKMPDVKLHDLIRGGAK